MLPTTATVAVGTFTLIRSCATRFAQKDLYRDNLPPSCKKYTAATNPSFVYVMWLKLATPIRGVMHWFRSSTASGTEQDATGRTQAGVGSQNPDGCESQNCTAREIALAADDIVFAITEQMALADIASLALVSKDFKERRAHKLCLLGLRENAVERANFLGRLPRYDQRASHILCLGCGRYHHWDPL